MLHNVVAAVYHSHRGHGSMPPAPDTRPRLDGWEWALVFFYL
jgi:proteasome lid subunit RPN8/RPN11